MRKIIFYLLLLISTVSFGQTTIANKLKITGATKDNLASRVMVQDSLTGELKWVLKNSLGTVKSVTGTSGVTVALGTSTPVIGLGAITPTSTNGVSATTMAYNDATSSIQTQLNGKQPVGTYATGTGTASGTNTGDNAVNTLYSGLVTNATHTGEVTGATALTITPKAVTLAKMDDVATGTVFYRKTAATGTPEVQTLATLKTDLGLTGTNSGDQTTVSGNAGTATTLQTGRTIAITGDLAYTSPTFNGSTNVTAAGTLATVNANVGSFTNASVTVNAKGLVTAASSGPTPQAALSGTGLVRSTAGAITYDTNAYITTVNGTAITPSSTNGVSAATMAFNDATSSIQTQLNGKQVAGTYATGTGTASGTNTGDNAVNSLYSGLVTNATHTGDATGATALTVKGINGTLLSGLATGILKNTTTTGVPSIATVRTDYAEPTTALGTGILKNTTTTGAHTIAVAADFPTLNQNTTGNAATVTTNANLTGVVTSVGNATAIADGAIALAKLAPTTAGFIPVGAVTTGIPTYVAMSGDVTIGSTGVTAIGASKVTNAMLVNSAVANLSGTNSGNQTIASTSDATSHTATLSATGGSLKLVEGSNITLTTSGTGTDGIVTIASTAGGTGTVTATGGALTANAVVLGAGTTDTKVSTGITTDGVAALNLGVNATTIGKVKLFGNTSGDATIQPSAVAGTGTVLTLPATSGTVALLSNITGTNSGTNTGDNAVNSLYSGLVSNVPTALSAGTISGTTYGITSDGSANDIILPEANTTQAGLLGAAKWNEIVANTAKVSNATHTGDATGSTALSVVGINGTLLSSLGTGILKNTTTTGVPSIAVAADFPTLNQNTTGTASNITGVYGGTITSGQVTTALTFTPENAANKQNSLTVDGSGVKYSTVDAVNAGLATKQNTITNPVTGTGAGATNTIPKFTGANDIGNSTLTDNGTTVNTTGYLSSNIEVQAGNNTQTASALVLNGASGSVRTISMRTAGVRRWGWRMDDTAEAGSNAGSDLRLTSYVDAGTQLSDVLFVKRSTGTISIGTNVAPYSNILNTQGGIYNQSTAGAGLILRTLSNGTTASPIENSILWKSNSPADVASINVEDARTNVSGVPMIFSTRNNSNVYAERFRIDNLGNVGFGTTTPIGKVNIFTGITGADFNIPSQQNGSISFSNVGASTAIPTMSGKSNDGTGLFLVSATNDVNASADFRLDARQNTGADYTTLTTPAFRFSRGGNSLIDVLRSGNVLIGTTVDNGWKFRVNGGVYLDGNIVQSVSNSRINGGDTVGSLIVSNSGTTTYLGLYGSAHATTPNAFSLVTNAAERINVNASGVVKISSLASGTSTQMVTADLNGNLGYQAIPSGGTTNLGYTASATNGIVTSSTGTDATIPLADGTNAGLLAPAGYNVLSNLESNTTNKTVWNNGKGNISDNTSYGDLALSNNTTGASNSAFGYTALANNITGSANTAFGTNSLASSIGSQNTAVGASSLTSSTASGNTAIGYASLANNVAGTENSIMGDNSFFGLTSGSNNVGIGGAIGKISDGATNATAIDNSVVIGAFAKVLADTQTNQIVVGYNAIGNGSNTTTIGNTNTTDTYLKGAVRGSSFISTQVTPTAKTATATLTIAEILTDITTVTSTTAVTLTLPTGTLTDAGVQSGKLAVNDAFEWTVINLGSSSGAVTMAAGTGHTYVGATSVAIGTSATFRTRKTAANTFVTYRI